MPNFVMVFRVEEGWWVSSADKTNLRAALPLDVLSVELFVFLLYFLVIVLVIEDSRWNFM